MLKNSIIIPIYFQTDESRSYELINSGEVPSEYYKIKDTTFYSIDVVTEEEDSVTGKKESRIYTSGNSFCSPLSESEVNELIFKAISKERV